MDVGSEYLQHLRAVDDRLGRGSRRERTRHELPQPGQSVEEARAKDVRELQERRLGTSPRHSRLRELVITTPCRRRSCSRCGSSSGSLLRRKIAAISARGFKRVCASETDDVLDNLRYRRGSARVGEFDEARERPRGSALQQWVCFSPDAAHQGLNQVVELGRQRTEGDGGARRSGENMAVKPCFFSLEIGRRRKQLATCGLNRDPSRSLCGTLRNRDING